MGHYIITSRNLQNIHIAMEHNEWGIDRKGIPINIGDTIELRTTKNSEDDEGGRYIATILVTSDPIATAAPSFEWPDKQYPLRFGFHVVRMIPEELQKAADEILLSLLKDHGRLPDNFLLIGGENMGDIIWASLMQFVNDLIANG